jgi:hypothetical protein
MAAGDRYGFTYVSTELRDEGVLWATLDRPERRNAISPEMHDELTPLFRRIAEDRDVFTLNSFQVNTVLRWEYRPGSRLFLVWSQGRRHRDLMNPLISWTEPSFDRSFGSQVGDAFRIFPTNVFLIKIDYAFLR